MISPSSPRMVDRGPGSLGGGCCMSATQERSGGWLTSALMALVMATGVGYVIAAYFASRWLTRSKKRRPEQTPADFDLAYDTITCRTADGLRLTGWVVEP